MLSTRWSDRADDVEWCDSLHDFDPRCILLGIISSNQRPNIEKCRGSTRINKRDGLEQYQ